MLLDDTVASCEIEEPFLQQFADVSEPHWDLLAPYITPLESSPREASRHTVLSHLQNWKRKMHPTYGDLTDILSHLFIDPPAEEETTLGDSNGNISLQQARYFICIHCRITHRVPSYSNSPDPQSCNHSCPESLSGLCSTPVHSEEVDITGKTIECKELGFSIVIPPGSVNYAVTLSVCCSFKQQLRPPDGYEFVSPVYVLHVTAGITFLEEVELSLNHWAVLSHNTSLAFALSPVPVGNSPCVLQPLNGGQFFPHHGTIKTKHFSLGTILRAIASSITYMIGLAPDPDTSESGSESEGIQPMLIITCVHVLALIS